MDHLGRVSQAEYHAALDRRDAREAELRQRIAELEAALRKIADMQSDDEPVAYTWGLEYFRRAHAIATAALATND